MRALTRPAPRATTVALACGAVVATAAVALPAVAAAAEPTRPYVSELHYDNDGTDEGEFVEVTLPPGTSVDGWSVVLYNGNGGGVYGTAETLSGTAPADARSAVVVDYPANGLQNGAPDGLALVDAAGAVVELLSYEGELTATDGPADGLSSTDIGAEEGSGTPVGASLTRDTDADGVRFVVTTTSSRGVPGGVAAGGGDDGGDDAGDGDGDAVEPATCDAEAVTLVSAVQGAGTETPLAGQTVTVEAAVTQLTPGLSGFFVQEEPADDDGDPATSEGVFVFRGGVDVSAVEVGDLVQVTGTASERFEQTQLAATDVVVCELVDVAATVDVPPTPLDLPADDAERESREGMLVTTGDTLLTVTDLFGPFRFGEIGLSASGLLRQPTDVLAPDDPQAAALAQANAESFLVVDDRGELGRQAAPWLDGDPRVRAGDTVDGPVVGSLAFSFGEYKVEPLEFFETTPAGSRPAEPDLGGGDRVAFFNVLNLFNGDGQGGGFPTSRGAGTPEELAAQRDGVVQAVDGLGAAVVGIIEVENDYGDGADSSIAQLVGALDAADDGVVDGSWAYVDPGTDTLGTDAIAVGLLYRPALATPVGEPATVDIDDGIDAPKNRWPLAQTFDLGGATRTVVVNHLKSKGSSCEDVATLPGVPADVAFDGDPDSDLEASCVRTRTYALDRVLRWLATDPVAASDATVLGGDLNSYAQETPLEVLEDAGWTDLVATLGEDATSYAFDGRFGRLDHAFASPGSATAFADAAVWQINSPEPTAGLYDALDTPGVHASSDHDPVLVSLPGSPQVAVRPLRPACEDPEEAPAFDDVPPADVHARAVSCLLRRGIVNGFDETTYGPARAITRGQTAALVARTLREAGVDLPVGDDAFADDEGVHEADVDALAAAGVVQGVTASEFRPDLPVSREQMASLLVRAVRVADGDADALATSRRWFDDVDGTHRAATDALAGAGLAAGRSAGVFAAKDDVTRAQMASFVARTLALLEQEG